MKVLDVDNLPTEIREAWAYFELFRKYGIPAEHIWFIPDNDNMLKVAIAKAEDIQKRLDENQDRVYDFVVSVGKMSCSQEETVQLWESFADSVVAREISSEILAEMWRNSIVRANLPVIVAALQSKGIMYNE